MSQIEVYQPPIDRPVPANLLAAIARQQSLKERELALREAEIQLSLNTPSQELPAAPQQVQPKIFIINIAGVAFLVGFLALMCLHFATVRSLENIPQPVINEGRQL